MGGRCLGVQEVLRRTSGWKRNGEWVGGIGGFEGGEGSLGGVGPGLGQVTGSAPRGWVTGDGEVEARPLRVQAALCLDKYQTGLEQPRWCKAGESSCVAEGKFHYFVPFPSSCERSCGAQCMSEGESNLEKINGNSDMTGGGLLSE